ncbi:MAG: tRNA uridine(34) 5-carboxymethylaminomethyl modification radical SAM/GNAT enzyme Elp3 [Coriobacteriales bacterium]|nr:tRNA uridine(34) 5-carboxymethylaminomethyl modification radical SAM/GNAT enzyme Elp3 [Coriobacteriales bacterium]
METLLLHILSDLKRTGSLDDKALAKIIHAHNKEQGSNEKHFSKKRLLPYYLKVREQDPERWATWGIDPASEQLLVQTLQVKPRRTASGVATITVLTKPWRCSSDCLYCPNDLRMPKSYLSDEPACQRAERNYFDPYLQVVSRLRALTHMGHATDKIELIVLGGTWSDYPHGYQIWFITELFKALNDGEEGEANARARRALYREKGLSNREKELLDAAAAMQHAVDKGALSYNQAFAQLYDGNEAWISVAAEQVANFEQLTEQHRVNQRAGHRVVGLVVETRPDTITSENLTLLRRLGCTKIQMGIQSLDPDLLRLNSRGVSVERIQEAFALLRLFGFKIHAHFMLNLLGATVAADKRDYLRLVTEPAYVPDEVKLYPCSLVRGTGLVERYESGAWQPYSEEELLDVLCADTLNTPPYLRISRMIRDISAQDIVAGNKKANLRQLVEGRIRESGKQVDEIRYREISTDETDFKSLRCKTLAYKTSVTDEHFLQWVTPQGRIAGFLRLSLPDADYVLRHQKSLPIGPHEAMIREVHVYGAVAKLHSISAGAQHLGLGKQLIEAACKIAQANGYDKVNVISSVGTQEYYRAIGFNNNGLYQQKIL